MAKLQNRASQGSIHTAAAEWWLACPHPPDTCASKHVDRSKNHALLHQQLWACKATLSNLPPLAEHYSCGSAIAQRIHKHEMRQGMIIDSYLFGAWDDPAGRSAAAQRSNSNVRTQLVEVLCCCQCAGAKGIRS